MAEQDSGLLKKPKHRGSAKNGPKDPKQSTRLTLHDYQLILSWLEKPGNREKVEGTENKTKVGGKNIVKGKAFEELAKFINQGQLKDSTLKTITGKSMGSRWTFYFDKFRKVKEDSESTGWGVTDEDYAAGITTVEQKQEFLCPLYNRLHALFYKSAKVKPLGEFESLIDGSVEGEGAVFLWSQVPDSLPVDEINIDLVQAVNNCLSSDLNNQGEDKPNMNNVGDGGGRELPDEEPGLEENHMNIEDSPPPAKGVGAHEDQDDEDLERVPEREAPPRRKRGRSLGQGTGATTQSRKRDSIGGKEKGYPSKKQVLENRHSINGAFADNLESINQQKMRIAEFKEKRLAHISAMEEKKASADEKRFLWEKRRAVLERADKKIAAAKASEDHIIASAMTSTRSVEEIQALITFLHRP